MLYHLHQRGLCHVFNIRQLLILNFNVMMTRESASDPSSEDRLYPGWLVDWVLPLVQPSGGVDPTPPVSTPTIQPEEDPIDTAAPVTNPEEDDFIRTERVVAVSPNPNRTVHRKLKGIHLFVSTLYPDSDNFCSAETSPRH